MGTPRATWALLSLPVLLAAACGPPAPATPTPTAPSGAQAGPAAELRSLVEAAQKGRTSPVAELLAALLVPAPEQALFGRQSVLSAQVLGANLDRDADKEAVALLVTIPAGATRPDELPDSQFGAFLVVYDAAPQGRLRFVEMVRFDDARETRLRAEEVHSPGLSDVVLHHVDRRPCGRGLQCVNERLQVLTFERGKIELLFDFRSMSRPGQDLEPSDRVRIDDGPAPRAISSGWGKHLWNAASFGYD